jgi:hypothetical protein
MEPEIRLQELKENFLQTFIDEGYTELKAIETWDIFINTYKESISKFSLPGVLNNSTGLQMFEHLKNSGELNEIQQRALNRITKLK